MIHDFNLVCAACCPQSVWRACVYSTTYLARWHHPVASKRTWHLRNTLSCFFIWWLIFVPYQVCTAPKTWKQTGYRNMDCKIKGRPCCIGTKGRWDVVAETSFLWHHWLAGEPYCLIYLKMCLVFLCFMLQMWDHHTWLLQVYARLFSWRCYTLLPGVCLSVCASLCLFVPFWTPALLLCRSTVWMMCVGCCPFWTPTFQISFTVCGSRCSFMLGTHCTPHKHITEPPSHGLLRALKNITMICCALKTILLLKSTQTSLHSFFPFFCST